MFQPFGKNRCYPKALEQGIGVRLHKITIKDGVKDPDDFHLAKAKLIFLFKRYVDSSTIKSFFPDVCWTKENAFSTLLRFIILSLIFRSFKGSVIKGYKSN